MTNSENLLAKIIEGEKRFKNADKNPKNFLHKPTCSTTQTLVLDSLSVMYLGCSDNEYPYPIEYSCPECHETLLIEKALETNAITAYQEN